MVQTTAIMGMTVATAKPVTRNRQLRTTKWEGSLDVLGEKNTQYWIVF
jgi:hypothetical protein